MSNVNLMGVLRRQKSYWLAASLAAAAILSGPVGAQGHLEESVAATDSMLSVPAPAWVPGKRDPSSRIEATSQGTTGHWQASARFLWNWSTGRWVAVAFTTRFDDSEGRGTALKNESSSATGSVQTLTIRLRFRTIPTRPRNTARWATRRSIRSRRVAGRTPFRTSMDGATDCWVGTCRL